MIDIRKYLLSFVLTCAIFATAFFASNFFSEKRAETVKSIQDNIAIDILSSETQFDLLKDVSCSTVDSSILTPQLEDAQILYLKKYYSLLEIKDYLLSRQLTKQCSTKKSVFVIYFYSNKGDCPDCTREGFVLTKLKSQYPDLRIYSFDYNLPLSAIDSMKTIFKIGSSLPALVIEDKPYIGYKSYADLDVLLPDSLKVATSTATSTKQVVKGK
jgi:hypothetical protein